MIIVILLVALVIGFVLFLLVANQPPPVEEEPPIEPGSRKWPVGVFFHQQIDNRQQAVDWVRQYQPPAVLSLVETSMTRALLDVTQDTLVVHRFYPDPTPNGTPNIEGYLDQQWRDTVFEDDRVLTHLTNEPQGNWDQLADWTARAMDHADTRGKRMAVLAFSVGVPPGDEDWMFKIWDKMRPVIDRIVASNGRHVLVVHEYAEKDMRTESPWHIGRVTFFFRRWCEARGIDFAKVPIIIGEYGLDDVNLDGSNRGWKQWRLSERDYANMIVEATDIHYSQYPNLIAALIYCWGGNRASWHDFDISTAYELQGIIGNRLLQEVPHPAVILRQNIKRIVSKGDKTR